MPTGSLHLCVRRRVPRNQPQPPIAGLIAESWRDALPPDRVERVVRFVQKVWASTPVHKYKRFHFGEKEPYLTQVLWMRLRKLQRDAGLTGKFSTESHVGEMDEETGEFGQRGRADIEYTSDCQGQEISVTFEFKKLRTTDHRKRYIEQGMLRFVSGLYSRTDSLAFMVGMTSAINAEEAITGVSRSMQNPTARQMLCMVKDQAGRYLRPPEPELASLMRFQTFHTRTRIEAPDIFLGHFFVDLVTRDALRKDDEDLPEPD